MDANTGDIKKESYKEFSVNMMMTHLSTKQKKKVEKKLKKGKDISLYQFLIDEIIPRTDGGALMIAEQYRFWTTQSYDSRTNTYETRYHYMYGDILVVNITPEGEIQWAKTIHKAQKTVNDGGSYSSYALMNKGSELYFMFNDHENNTPDKETNEYKYFYGPTKKSLVTLVRVDQNGNTDRKLLFNTKQETIIHPKWSYQINKNTMMLQALKRSKQQFIRISIK